MLANLVLFSISCVVMLSPLRSLAIPSYRVVTLNIDRSGPVHLAGFNAAGQVIGYYETKIDEETILHAFLWEKGKTIDLGTLPGDQGSQPFGINASGQIVGRSMGIHNRSHAFLWERGKMHALDGTESQSSATAINNRGQIAGYSESASKSATIWFKGSRTDLVFPHPTRFSDGFSILGINDCGQLIGGYSYLCMGSTYAFLWQNGAMYDFDTDENVMTQATAINNQGTVIGQRQLLKRKIHGYLWQHDREEELPFEPKALNDHDQIFGEYAGHLFLYANGKTESLEPILPKHPDDDSFGNWHAIAINNRSQILCQNRKGCFVLVPENSKFGR